MAYNKKCICSTCNGTKAKPGTQPHKCNSCQGKGHVNYRQGGLLIKMPCNACEGAGTVIKQFCTSCKGIGFQRK
jgi:molecular chaperone DnaJ